MIILDACKYDITGIDLTLNEISKLIQICETVCHGDSWYEICIRGDKPVGENTVFNFEASFRHYIDADTVQQRMLK